MEDIEVLFDGHEEGIVPLGGLDLGVGHFLVAIEQGLDDLARALRRKTPVAGEGDDEHACPDGRQCR